jgi:hypothetical protein
MIPIQNCDSLEWFFPETLPENPNGFFHGQNPWVFLSSHSPPRRHATPQDLPPSASSPIMRMQAADRMRDDVEKKSPGWLMIF